ncbi:MAG: glycosyltransferase [Thermoguttaceae bacterium]
MDRSADCDPGLTIAIVSTQRDWYGGEEQIRLLAQGLRNRGHRVHLLARRRGVLAERMRSAGFAVGEFAGNGRNPLALWQLRRHLCRIRPDVLQYNDSHALTAAGLASSGLGIAARIAMRHVSLPIRSPWRFRAWSDRVVCVSQAVADVCRCPGLPQDMLRVVFAVTDPCRVRAGDRLKGRSAAGVSQRQPMILVVASLNRHKGHAVLLDALPAVLRRHPQVRLILAGDGPEKQSLQSRAEQLGIQASVTLLGYRRDVPDLMRAADLLVLPSLAGEGLPVTLLDAMFAGVPIVATPIGGAPELLGASDCAEPAGRLAPPGDSNALARALIDALDRPEESARRASRARLRAEQSCTPEHLVEGMLAVYREVLQARAAAN